LLKKTSIIEFLSFGSPRAVVYNLSAILLALAIVPTAFLGRLPVKCIWKSYVIPLFFKHNCPTSGIFTDCRCPACGLTRGVSSILHGEFSVGQNYNRLSIFVLLFMIGLIIYNLLKFKKPR